MSKIKICGLTRPCDIDFVNEAKPDFCGFILGFPKSRRCISISTLYTLRERLDASVKPVGVFVDDSSARGGRNACSHPASRA